MRKTLLSLGMFALLHSQVMAQFPAPYCAETFPDGVEPITLVDFAGINNTTSAGSGTEHEDFTAMTGNVYQGTSYPITLKGNTVGSYEDFFTVFIDWNQDGSFDVSETYDIGSVYDSDGTDAVTLTGSIAVPGGALTGNTRMRVTKRYDVYATSCDATNDYGQTEDYTINVSALVTCSGTPVAGTASGTAYTCDTVDVNLAVTGYTIGIGIGIQWQSSNDGITYANIPAATGNTYTGLQTDSTYYRAVVTCTASGNTDTTNVVYVQIVPCTCVPTYTDGTTDGDYIGRVELETINNITTESTVAPFYTFYNDLSADLMRGEPYTLTLSGGTYDENDLIAWIDYNQDGVFDNVTEKLGEIDNLLDFPATGTITFNVPVGAALGATRLRVRDMFYGIEDGVVDPCNEGSYGETEDYVINILPAPACTNVPVGGSIASQPTDTVMSQGRYVLSGSNGDHIQWYGSIDGGVTYVTITGETNDTLDIYYNFVADNYMFYAVSSSPGCTNDTSNVFTTSVISNNDVCDAFPLTMGVNGPYTTFGATAQVGEVGAPDGDCETQQTWCDPAITNTVWFTFIAPTSGRVSINATGFDTQLAVWKADNCSDLLDASAVTMISANDDDSSYAAHGGAEYSSFINGLYCLEPGVTYYVQLDVYDETAPGITEIILTDIGAPTSPVVSLEDSSFCNTITMDAGNAAPGTTYLWSNSATTQTTDFTTSGTVSVTVTDSLGCTATDNAVITDIAPVASFSLASAGMGTYNFTNTSTPVAAITAYEWNFGDGSPVSTATNPSHTYTSNGTYVVTLTITSACGSEVTNQSVVVTGLGLTELSQDQSVKVYPNPATEILNVTSNGNIREVSVVSTTGQYVIRLSNVNTTNVQLPVSGLERGLYIIHVSTDHGVSRTRVTLAD